MYTIQDNSIWDSLLNTETYSSNFEALPKKESLIDMHFAFEANSLNYRGLQFENRDSKLEYWTVHLLTLVDKASNCDWGLFHRLLIKNIGKYNCVKEIIFCNIFNYFLTSNHFICQLFSFAISVSKGETDLWID